MNLRRRYLRRVRTAIALRAVLIVAAALVGLAVFTSVFTSASAYAGKIGVEASIEFVDRGKLIRPFEVIGKGGPAPIDANGWATTDAQTVVFDERAIPAWAPPIDDPLKFQPDVSGTYHLSFNGKATIGAADAPNITITNPVYQASINTTTADVTLAPNTPALMVLTFTNTQRTASSPTNTGITNLKLIRPGYPANTTQIFTDRLLKAFAPFSFIRFMGALNTNYDAGYYGDSGHHLIEWAERSLPADATQQLFPELGEGKKGVAWEYVILLANAVNKDVWINIPVSASGSSPDDTASYIYQLAKLFKDGNSFTGNVGLKPGLKIYLEHSNEVWNFGFSQYTWNKLAAQDEVAQGGSLLNQDGVTDPETWARRRHAKRLYESAKIFEAVYGAGSLGKTILPVYAHWTVFPDQFIETLTWMSNTYGAPKNYFWGLAQTHYFNDQAAAPNASVAEVLGAMRTDSDNSKDVATRLHAIAENFGLQHLAYEAGPDNGGGSTTNIGNRIMANRASGMKALIEHHVRNNWFALGGGLYNYFSVSGAYSRYGCWGLTDDLANLNTEKFKAIYALTGEGSYALEAALPPPINSSSPAAPKSNLPAPTQLTAAPSNAQVSLNWNAVPGATSYTVFYTTGGNFQQAVFGLTDTRYLHKGLTNNVQYTYYITASDRGSTSTASNPVSVVPR
jgi:hypothetical protein